jgi:nucleotide-binding universal stress UspA family protein
MQNLLLCTDGEESTRKAEDLAFRLAGQFRAHLVGLFVVDPFLQKFTSEIYAVGREACREHIDRALREQGGKALEILRERSQAEGLKFEAKIRCGPPEEEILAEIREGRYDLLIMGAKLLKTWRERWESVNLPQKIFSQSPIPMLFVR